MKQILFHTLFIVIAAQILAQPSRKGDEAKYLQFGIKAGAIYTEVSDLSNVLVSESYYTGYTFKNEAQWGFTGGIFINYKFTNSISAIYSELSYAPLKHVLHYTDINDFEYDLRLEYQYISLELWYKAYVFKGLNIGIGPRLGFNLTPGGIYYTSNGEEIYGPDIRIQQQMRDVLKGRNNFSLAISMGYEFVNGITLDIRYYQGLSDVMVTEVNNFNFIENQNTSRVFQFTLGYAFPYNLIQF